MIQDMFPIMLDGRMVKLPSRPAGATAHLDGFNYHGVIWDFNYQAAGVPFVRSDTGSVTRAQASLVGGVMTVTNSATDNDEAIEATGAQFLFARGKPIIWGGRIALTEANTDDCNFLIGLVSGSATNYLGDNGAGPAASYSGANIFKVDGGTVFQAEVSLAGSQQTDTDIGAVVSAAYVNFHCEIYDKPFSNTDLRVDFYKDGAKVATYDFTPTSPAQMAFALEIKNGAGNAEIANYDTAYCVQAR